MKGKNESRILIIFLFTSLLVFALTPLGAQTKKSMNPSKKDNSCTKCHDKLKGEMNKVFIEWKDSVHGEHNVTCDDCHGGDPTTMNKALAKKKSDKFIGIPKKKEILDFCGRTECHTTQLLQFQRGPHYKSVLETSKPNCTTCHGVHIIKKPTAEIIKGKACSECHSENYAKDIILSINSIESNLHKVDKNIEFLETNNAEVVDLQKRLERTTQLFRELLHVFSKADIQTTKTIIELEITNLKTESISKVALTQRLDLLYILTVGFSLATIIGFMTYSVLMLYKRKKHHGKI